MIIMIMINSNTTVHTQSSTEIGNDNGIDKELPTTNEIF